MMKKVAWFSFIFLFSFLYIVGCQQAEEEGAYEPNPLINEGGGAREGEVQGKSYTSIYQYKNRNDADQRIHSRIFSDLDLGNRRDYDPGRTKTPGTRIGRDQITFGFADHRHNDADVMYQGYGSNMYIDRQVLSEGISQMLVGLQDVTRASVLVTDEECLIAYDGTGDQKELLEQVWMSGLAMTPRWFHVYATDNPELVKKVRHIATNPEGHNMNPRELESYVEVLIQDMKQEHPELDSQGKNASQKLGTTNMNTRTQTGTNADTHKGTYQGTKNGADEGTGFGGASK